MDPDKLSAILGWPQPVGLKATQRFLGFANYYRRFIRDFSKLVTPITKLTRKGADSRVWPEEAVSAFTRLKGAFASAPVLIHPNINLPFVLEVDASETAVGAVLSQRLSSSLPLHPCAFFSRRFSPPQCNYDIGDRELLAIILALREWRHLLEGSVSPVTILTDHKNLTYLSEAKRLNARQARWSLFLSRFNFVLTYRPGSRNTKADALSRQFDPAETDPGPPAHIISPHCFLSTTVFTSSSPLLAEIREAQSDAPSSCPSNRLFVPEPYRTVLLRTLHDCKAAGHPGTFKLARSVSRSFWWPSWHRDVRDYVAACQTCARAKSSRRAPTGLLVPLPMPQQPWSHVAVDFVVDLPPSKGYTTVLSVVDRFSKMAHFVPLPKLPSAAELVPVFIREVVRLHGIPKVLTSDRGVQFVSLFWKGFCRALGIDLAFSSAYHPQSNGAVERVNQSLGQFLRLFSTENPGDWTDHLPWAEFAHNNAVHESTGVSPFFCCFGTHPTVLPDSFPDQDVPSLQDALQRLSSVRASTEANLRRSAARQKQAADRRRRSGPSYALGDRVWLATKHLHIKAPSRKLLPRFVGPYKVVRRLGPVTYSLDLPSSLRVHNAFHCSLLKPLLCNRFSRRVPSPPPPVTIGDSSEFEVQAILDSRLSRGVLQYLVHWKGYGPEERSWVAASDVHAPRLCRSFHLRYPGKACPRGVPRRGGAVTVLTSPQGERAPGPARRSSPSAPGHSPGATARRSRDATAHARQSRDATAHARRSRDATAHVRRSRAATAHVRPQIRRQIQTQAGSPIGDPA